MNEELDGKPSGSSLSRFTRLGRESRFASYENNLRPRGGNSWGVSDPNPSFSLLQNAMLDGIPLRSV